MQNILCKESCISVIILVLLIVLNPLTYSFNKTAGGMLPDSPLYLVMGEQLLSDGRLSITGWGHIDSGIILPPVYPMLIAVAKSIKGYVIYNSQVISTIALLLTSIPLFFLVRHLSTVFAATSTVFLVQINYYYYYFGTASLSEATFLLLLVVISSLTIRLCIIKNTGSITILCIGILGGLLFLTRHIGIFYIPAFIILLGIFRFRKPGKISSNQAIESLIIFLVGYSLLLVPYTIFLNKQTGMLPVDQHYRLNQYVVKTDDYYSYEPVFTDYKSLYKYRRDARMLLPDSREMLAYVVNSQRIEGFRDRISLSKFGANIISIAAQVCKIFGLLMSILFLVSMASACIAAFISRQHKRSRIILPVIIFTYIITLSLVTGIVERYIAILFPLITALVVIETYYFIVPFLRKRISMHALPDLIILVLLLSMVPEYFTSANISMRYGKKQSPVDHCRKFIRNHEPIFSLSTLEPYLLDGTYRVLPNDNLDKIARYGDLTGVRWLVMRKSSVNSSEMTYYHNADWLRSGVDLSAINGRYKLQCESNGGDAQLYKII